jgi:nucleolar protein 53
MGKKIQGAKLRAAKRAKIALDELQEQQAEAAAALTVTTKADADLFVVDRIGEVVPHHKRPASDKVKNKFQKNGMSQADKKQVDALLSIHDAAKIKEMAVQGRKLMDSMQDKRHTRSSTAFHQTKTNFDLWNAPEAAAAAAAAAPLTAPTTHNKLTAHGIAATTATVAPAKVKELSGIGSTLAGTAPAHVVITAASVATSKRLRNGHLKAKHAKADQAVVAVDVAAAGQSYHPDPVQHQAVLQTAAQLEVARNRAIQDAKTPISQGLSAETKALLLGDDDESSEDDEQRDGPIQNAGDIPKRANKLTKAQRNKQKRLRVERAIQRKAKLTKKLLNQVSEVPRYKKELKQEQKAAAQTKQEKLALQMALLEQPIGKDLELQAARQDPVHAPTLPVALPTELRSSLRSLVPKGSLVTDRVLSLTARRQMPRHPLTAEAVRKRTASQKKRKLSVKGKHNRDALGDNFEILG